MRKETRKRWDVQQTNTRPRTTGLYSRVGAGGSRNEYPHSLIAYL